MSSRFGWLFSALFASSILVACAEGAPAAPPGQQLADPLIGAPKAMCGDGIWDKKAEMCDCPATASTMCMAPADVTCQSLGMGTGNVYCAAHQCTFVTSSCSSSMMGGAAAASGGVAGNGT